MSDAGVGGSEGMVAALLETPVGRRWLLKAGVSAAAAAAMLRGGTAWSAEDDTDEDDEDVLAREAGTPHARTLHFALGSVEGVENLRLIAGGREIPLKAHTRTTRYLLKTSRTLWRKLRRSELTHFASVPLPRERGLLVSVHGTRGDRTVVVVQTFHAPVKATRALARLAYQLDGHYGLVAGSAERLARLGLHASRITSVREVVDLESVVDAHQTAITLTMCHPNVATIDANGVATTKSLLGQTPEVGTLGTYISQMQQSGQDFATLVPAVDANGQPSQITVDKTTTTFSTFQLNQSDPDFKATARSAFRAGIKGVRDTGDLGTVLTKPLDESPKDTKTWHQPEGIAIVPQPYVPPSGLQAGIEVKIQNTGLLFGTYTVLNGAYAGGKVPLKLYNNYVRWVSVYVQYLKADGTNLSLNDTPTWPDTKYAQSLGLLPQVFTVLGVPIWDTNTIEVTLDFPPGAVSARLLFCGLGSDLVGGGWRQYFPATAYPDHIAPQDEVLWASISTGVFTLGLTAFALVTDTAIANTFAACRKAIGTFDLNVALALTSLVQASVALTTAETLATAVAAGGATYADVTANKGDLSNLWSILVSLGSVIPKILFNPALNETFVDIASSLLEDEGADKIIDAIPIIGEVLAVITAVGDAVTLAEAIGETVASPWVIENQVGLSYPATVTVSRDSLAATWPVTARSWRIEAAIDGAVALSPKTGPLNADGKTQSDPIVLKLDAPFGGQTITWSFVALDAAGNQVGTGSLRLANNDPANPPGTVAFAIKELPAAITAATVFKRADTTAYDDTAGGYTWSSGVVDNGTRTTSTIQEITGVAIATRLGVAGVVWKQNDRYYLRGVPVAENGTTLPRGTVTRQGYARRPFLLFDALVGDGDLANHVLLEPDDTESGYHVRRLVLDATTGSLNWDSTVSLGYFTLPVSAAALHGSGRVITVHTDSGRLGQVKPAATPLPPLANYTAGPGTQVGLLSSPTAVAVTQPGTLIVLEAGVPQLAAFDLNGNPVRQFGSTAPADFTLPLPGPATYLDVAVDGSGQIYVLFYRNDGSQPGDYGIDVYTPRGAPLASNSPGSNIAHLAVDYWRSIYGANYTPLLDEASGQPRIDPALGVPEPSISRFDPS